jgi:ABC-type glycerol-3-phosphate transport system substrate-binding protein
MWRLGVLTLAAALFAAACGGDDEEASDTGGEAAEGDFSDLKVVMILDGAADDGGWNTTKLRGGDDIVEAFPGVDFSYVEEVAPGQTATNAFEDAAESGADGVIGVTF